MKPDMLPRSFRLNLPRHPTVDALITALQAAVTDGHLVPDDRALIPGQLLFIDTTGTLIPDAT